MSAPGDPRLSNGHHVNGLEAVPGVRELPRRSARRRAGRRLRDLAAALLAVPVVIALRLLRLLVLIRVGALKSHRYGHYAFNTELYLCKRDAGLHPKRSFDVFYNVQDISNRQLKLMWDRTLRVWEFARLVDRVNRAVPGWEVHVVPQESRDLDGLFPRTRIHLAFTDDEVRRGEAGLRRLQIPERAPFICFHARDAAYERVWFPDKPAGKFPSRNSSVASYLPAVEEAVRRGYYAVRVGAVVEEPLPDLGPRIIDYAQRFRSDFLDVYLGAHCAFLVASSTGILGVPMIFRRPLAIVNFLPLELVPTWGRRDLFIPKRLWLRGERRFLTFGEILRSGLGRAHRGPDDAHGIEVVDNSPDEILALVTEMDDRLRGAWRPEPDDEELQARFWALYERNDMNGVFLSRIGASFLRENRTLLD